MIPEPENVYILDERATARARRLVATLNSLEARGKADGDRYKRLLAELNGLSIKNKRKSGASVSVPRI